MTIEVLIYLLIGLVICMIGSYIRSRAWNKTWAEELSESWGVVSVWNVHMAHCIRSFACA